MKHYLLDTNILGYMAEFKAGITTPKATNFGKNYQALPPNSRLFISSISVGENEYGYQVYPNSDPMKRQFIRSVMDPFPDELRLNIDSSIANPYYGKLRASLFNKYAPKTGKKKKRVEEWKDPTTSKNLQIQENDVWIASVAMAYNLILVTSDNMSAIKQVVGSDLEIIDWINN